jgi:hypothetical protein
LEDLVRREISLIGKGNWTDDQVEVLAELSLSLVASLTTEAVSKISNKRPALPEHSIFLDPRLAVHRSISASIQEARADGLVP